MASVIVHRFLRRVVAFRAGLMSLPMLIGAADVASASGGRFDSPCGQLPFFAVYGLAGAVNAKSETHVELRLRVDVHGADCGAPDCYGDDLVLSLALVSQGRACRIREASARSTPFDVCGGGEPYSGPWTDRLVVAGRPNLADPSLRRVELRSHRGGHAVLLTHHDYFVYEGVTPTCDLKPDVPPDSSTGQCYGATSSDATSWRSRYWVSPLAFQPLAQATPEQLASFNEWAAASGINRDLLEMVRRGFDLSDVPKIDVDMQSASRVVYRVNAPKPREPEQERTLRLEFSKSGCGARSCESSAWLLTDLQSL